MAIVYSTSTVHPRDRVAYWREVVIRDLPRHEFHSHVGPGFYGTIEVGALGGMGVAVFECDPCRSTRTERDVAHCYNDDFILSLQLSGRMLARQDDREALIERGSFTLFDTARVCGGTHLTKVKSAVFSIPRQALEARLGNVGALTGREMSMHQPLVALAAEFLAMLPARLDALAGPSGSLVAEQALDLIALAFSSVTNQGGVTLSSPRAVALLRVKSVVETRLSDPELRPAAVAAEAGISVRYANDLLSQEGSSIERYILHRRLERCRQALEDSAQDHRLIGEIAFSWGFSDLSHFGRRFRAGYGMTPGDCRRRAHLAPPAACGLEARPTIGEQALPTVGRESSG
jgi:AraC-like DNA-binding protein